MGATPARATPAPDSAYTRYVIQVYDDLFHREPDPQGLAGWVGALSAGRVPRVAVANAITSSREFRAALIADLYRTYLGRGPDPDGLQGWLDAMSAGATIAQIGSGFIASPEYYAQAGGTPQTWVTALYRAVLGRGANASEVAFWVNQQARGVSRQGVATGFLLSTEHLSTVLDGYYRRLLHRGLDPVGQRSWVSQLQAGGRDEDVIGSILASVEYWGIATARREVGLVLRAPQTTQIGAYIPIVALSLDQEGNIVRDVTAEATFAYPDATFTCPQRCTALGPVGPHTIYATWQGLSASTTEVESASPVAMGPLVYGGDPPLWPGVQLTFFVSAVDSLGRPVDPGPGVLTVSDPASSCQELTCVLNTPGPVGVVWTSTLDPARRTGIDLVIETR